MALNNMLDQVNTHTHTHAYPQTQKNMLSKSNRIRILSARRTYSRVDYMLGHKIDLKTNLRGLKSYQALFLIMQYETSNELQEGNWKIHKHLEIKHYVYK